MFRNKRVDIRHATWRTAQAVQVLCAIFPKPLSWCFPSVLDRQTKLYTYSAIFSFISPLGVLEHSSFGIYRFKADHFLSMHCVPCVLCPRLPRFTRKFHFDMIDLKTFSSGKRQETCCSVASRTSGKRQETCCSVASRASGMLQRNYPLPPHPPHPTRFPKKNTLSFAHKF